YWKGKDNVVILDTDESFLPTPLYPDGQGSQPKSVVYVKLPNGTATSGPNLVYEGSDKVSVLATIPAQAAPTPPPVMHLQYRSAADSTWRDAGALTPDKAVDIKVEPKETDMPHSVLSLWVFRVTSENPSTDAFHLKITTHKGRDVVNWPGHPDFYANGEQRVVADHKRVKTHMTGVADGELYDQGGTWAPPDKLVSYGTGLLYVFINVTSATSDAGTPPTGYFLEVHNATIIGPEVRFGDRFGDMHGKNDLKHYEFKVPVNAAGMDGPYQPESRWGFRVMATFAEIPGVAGLCPGCFGYDIEYELTVVAVHDAKAGGITG